MEALIYFTIAFMTKIQDFKLLHYSVQTTEGHQLREEVEEEEELLATKISPASQILWKAER